MKKRLSAILLIVAVATALGILLTPIATRGGIRAWVRWQAYRQGLTIEIGSIDAPFLQPVTLHRVNLKSAEACRRELSFSSPRLTLDLNLRGLLFRRKVRAIRQATVVNPSIAIRMDKASEPGQENCRWDWSTLQTLLPDAIAVRGLNFTFQSGETLLRATGLTLTASEMDSGDFLAREIEVTLPAFHQKFARLRGATAWEDNRLTLGALSLARGFDVESLALDLGQLVKQKIAVDLRLDAFGGKVLASLKGQAGEKAVEWDAAGSVSQISLAQMSAILELPERATGSVHAGKFTFRGTSEDFSGATASIWAEVSELVWGKRTANTIMIGASLFNRRVQVQQLYVKQNANTLTLNGEALLPLTFADWLHPDFQGTVAASIDDLGPFAQLFGESVENFSGQLTLEGAVNTHERNLGGRLTLQGRKIALLGVPFDQLKAILNLHDSEIGLEGVELHRKTDFLMGEGTVNLTETRRYSGRVNASILSLNDYAAFFPAQFLPSHLGGGLALEWAGDGTRASHSGAFHVTANRLRVLSGDGAAPIDADLIGTYSPQNISFTKFQLANDHATFTGLLTASPTHFQVQNLNLDLNGEPRLQGRFSAPFALARFRETGDLAGALDENTNFDVDLKVTGLDLAEMNRSFGLTSKITGSLDGKVSITGALATLQIALDGHLKNFSPRSEPSPEKTLALDLILNYDSHLASFQGDASASGDHLKFQATLPILLNKETLAAGLLLQFEKDFSASAESAGINVSTLPDFLPRGLLRGGTFAGRLALANRLSHPQIVGEMEMRGVSFDLLPFALPPLRGLSGKVNFDGETARGERLSLLAGDVPLEGAAVLDFRNLDDLSIDFSLDSARLEMDASVGSGRRFSRLAVEPAKSADLAQLHAMSPAKEAVEIQLRGSAFDRAWSVTLWQKTESNQEPFELSAPTAHDFATAGPATFFLGNSDEPGAEESISVYPEISQPSQPARIENTDPFIQDASPDFPAIPAAGFTLRFR